MSESLKNRESFGDKVNNYYNANFMLNIKSKYGENSINLIVILNISQMHTFDQICRH